MASGNPSVHPYGLDPDTIDRPVFTATIRPHQSLSRRGFRVVMGGCCAVSLAVSVWAWRMGFWPVAGFFGLDFLGLYIAFRVSYRQGRAFELLELTPIRLLFRKVSPRGDVKD